MSDDVYHIPDITGLESDTVDVTTWWVWPDPNKAPKTLGELFVDVNRKRVVPILLVDGEPIGAIVPVLIKEAEQPKLRELMNTPTVLDEATDISPQEADLEQVLQTVTDQMKEAGIQIATPSIPEWMRRPSATDEIEGDPARPASSLTTDPNDPRLTRGVDSEPVPQADAYLVLSEEERSKGFVRPLRRSYIHVGPPGPTYPLADLTDEQKENYSGEGYVKYEAYPPSESPKIGRYWTQAQLDAKGCGVLTTMGTAIAETYARDPKFYGATYCCGCNKHLPVDEFCWDGTDERVGS